MRSPVKKWLANFTSRPGTAVQYKSRFNNYLEWAKDDPQSLIEKANDVNWLADHMGAYWEHLNSLKISPLTRHDLLSTVRSFYKWNNKALPMPPHGYRGALPTFESDKIYTQSERRKLFSVCSSLFETAVLTVENDTALRIGVLRGLRWGMVADQMDSNFVVMEIPGYLPDEKGVNCNKTGVKHFSAFGIDTIRALKQLVSERKMEPQSFIFASEKPGFGYQEKPASLATLGRIIPNLAEMAGIQKYIDRGHRTKRALFHGHGFRRLFSDSFRAGCQALHLPFDTDLINHLLGHKLQYNSAYSKFDRKFVLEAYSQLYPFIRILPDFNVEPAADVRVAPPNPELLDMRNEKRDLQEEILEMVIRHENRLSKLEKG